MTRPTTEELVLTQWDRLVDLTSGLGHQLGAPEQDTEVSLVAECAGCRSTFAVDGQERPYLFGEAMQEQCRGAKVVQSY